jgi:hypothetical protein
MALVDLKSNLANFRADFPQEGKLKSPGNLPGSMPMDIQKKSPNNAPTQRYINDIKVERVIKPKPSPVNPIATTLKDKTSNIVTISTIVKDKVSAISPIQTILKPKDSTIAPIKTEVKSKSSNIAPIKTEVKSKSSNIVPIKPELKGKESKIIPINTVVKAKDSSIKASAFTTTSISTQHNDVKPTFNKNVLEIGTYKIDNQLGSMGSPFKYLKDGAIATKKFSDTGYSAKRKYNDSIKSVKGQSDKSLLYAKGMEKNSPSAIDAEYAKYDLQEESYNPTYMKQPFVVRSIGRRWGFRTSPGAFDDGLIRGGMTTAVERSALDTARIAKWMASPKGLLWVVKQVGLGLTNPKVESSGPTLLGRPSRIHSGITSLLSVPTTAFGLHFTRHGIPILNATGNYEAVIKARNDGDSYKNITTYELGTPQGNRLIKLRKDLLPAIKPGKQEKKQVGKFASVLQKTVAKLKSISGHNGAPIQILSGLAGPNSVYGIGTTTISRFAFTDDKSVSQALKQNWKTLYTFDKQYATNEAKTVYKSSNTVSTQTPQGKLDIDKLPSSLKPTAEEYGKTAYSKSTDDMDSNPYQLKDRLSAGKISKESNELAERKGYSDKQYAGSLRATTKHDFDADKDNTKNTVEKVDTLKKGTTTKDSLRTTITNATKDNVTPGAKNTNNAIPDKYIETNAAKVASYPNSPNNSINDYITLAYNKIPKQNGVARTIPNDFRNDINKNNPNLTPVQKGIVGINPNSQYYVNNDIQSKTGFGLGKPGEVGRDRSEPNKFIKKGTDYSFKKANNRTVLTSDGTFHGDMITGLDIGKGDPMPDGYKDFVKFWFEDATSGTNIMAFRATLNGFTDSFSPGWDAIAIMGRPDSAYLYSSFERSISFNFTVAATTRSEMIPMWRKLNYLSTYTMPDLVGGSKPSGPMMRFTIGDLFHRTPGFITSLSYTIPDDATWDIAEADDKNDTVGKQLPMIMEVSISLTVIGDYRPQKMGRAYSLSPRGGTAQGVGNWLGDADIN